MAYDFLQSPNYWKGRLGQKVEGICFHHTGGTFSSAKNTFLSPSSQVSATYLIRKDGYVLQMVSIDDSAWTQGVSFAKIESVKNRCAQIVKDKWGVNPNTYLIGIEIEGSGEAFTDAIYNIIIQLTKELSAKYGFEIDRYHLIGHYEVNPIDKAGDPLEMDWNRLITGAPAAPPNYSLYVNATGIMLKILSGYHDGPFTIINKLTNSITDEGVINMSGGSYDRLVSPGANNKLYQVTWGGVTKEIDLRPTAPTPPTDWEAEYKKLKVENDSLKSQNEVLNKDWSTFKSFVSWVRTVIPA